jgi:hypothetical protein
MLIKINDPDGGLPQYGSALLAPICVCLRKGLPSAPFTPSSWGNHMRHLAMGFLMTSLLAATGAAYAESADDACAALRSARIHLVSLMGATDQATRDNHREQIKVASARLDTVIAAMRQGKNAADAARAGEFQTVWEAFKTTRETEIIPAVYAGNSAAARSTALGVQAERMKKMKAVMGCQ